MYCLPKLSVTGYKEYGKLPDPFRFNDGSYVKDAADWSKRRQELIATAVELQYGSLIPEPEFLEVEPLGDVRPGKQEDYRIITGTRACPVKFIMTIHRPLSPGKHPVVIDGDNCWAFRLETEIWKKFIDNDILFATFNRTEIVPDRRGLLRNSDIHKAYPDKNFSTILAWAWGYSRVTDALQQMGLIDDHIVFTGLSRGGKTALVAGALDERAWITNPEAPCAGGSLYRSSMKAYIAEGNECRSEELEDIVTSFPDWFSPEMQNYKGRVNELPFDEHELKALIAPRIYFDSEAVSDIWAGPVQAYQSDLAAKEVYRFLGAEDNILWYWRAGFHGQFAEDFDMLLNLIQNRLHGEPLSEKFGYVPFDNPPSIYDWRAPESVQ